MSDWLTQEKVPIVLHHQPIRIVVTKKKRLLHPTLEVKGGGMAENRI